MDYQDWLMENGQIDRTISEDQIFDANFTEYAVTKL